jgi:hypothetical protein
LQAEVELILEPDDELLSRAEMVLARHLWKMRVEPPKGKTKCILIKKCIMICKVDDWVDFLEGICAVVCTRVDSGGVL